MGGNEYRIPGGMVPRRALLELELRQLDEKRRQILEKAGQEIVEQDMHADALAALELARHHCPEDLRAWGRTHQIPTFAEVTWMAGFLAGWRVAHATPSGRPEGDGEPR